MFFFYFSVDCFSFFFNKKANFVHWKFQSSTLFMISTSKRKTYNAESYLIWATFISMQCEDLKLVKAYFIQLKFQSLMCRIYTFIEFQSLFVYFIYLETKFPKAQPCEGGGSWEISSPNWIKLNRVVNCMAWNAQLLHRMYTKCWPRLNYRK